MQPLNLCSILASVALVLAVAPQGQDQGDPGPGGKGSRLARAKRLEEMQGAWRLTKLESRELRGDLRQQVAYCLIVENYLSIELHVGWSREPGGEITRKDFQAGMHRFEFDARDRMVTSTLIGSFVSYDELLQFEAPGKSRSYAVDVTDKEMTWKRDDGQTFEFERISEGKPRRKVTNDKPTTGGGTKDGGGSEPPPK